LAICSSVHFERERDWSQLRGEVEELIGGDATKFGGWFLAGERRRQGVLKLTRGEELVDLGAEVVHD